MIGTFISLATYGIGTGGVVGNLLFQLEQLGFFAYVLPFLMIFALVFAILTNIKLLGENKGINVILALAVSLMALQFNFVSYFFAEIFPRMGVVLSILLVAIILLGLFLKFDSPGAKWGFGIPLGLAFVLIVFQSLDIFNWSLGFGNIGYFLQDNLGIILTGILVVGGIVGITLSKGKRNNPPLAAH